MAYHFSYNQGLDVSDGIAELESIGSTPSSERAPSFRASTRSSTWPMATNGSHDVRFDYDEGIYDGGIDERTQSPEIEASDSGSGGACGYIQTTSLQMLTRPSDI